MEFRVYSGVYLVHAFKCTPLEVGVKGNTSPPPILTFSLREFKHLEHSNTIEKRHPRTAFFYGRGERAQTFDLSVPNRARYQLRHTPKLVQLCVLPFIVAQMRQKVQF